MGTVVPDPRQDRKSDCHGIAVFFGDYAGGVDVPPPAQRPFALEVRSCIQQLLASQAAARTGSGNNGESVLRDNYMSFLKEFWAFVRVRKKYWLLPILTIMVIIGTLLVLAQGSAVAPFIYTLF